MRFFPARLILSAFLALSLAGCGSNSAGKSVGFLEAWSQFLELDSPAESVSPAAPAARATAPSGSAAAINQLADQMTALLPDAAAILESLPSAEENYRGLPARFQDSAGQVSENKTHSDAATVHRRLVELVSRADQVLDRQHGRYSTVQTSFNQRLGVILKRVPELEQACAKIQTAGSAPVADQQACARFQSAASVLKTKADLVAAGFVRLESVYQEVRQTQQQLSSQILTAPAQ